MIEDYKEKFWIPGIDFMSFNKYAIAKSGRLVNFKSIVYPNQKSAKRFTRRKQLIHRSYQAKLFDMLINIGYFDGLGEVIREMPIIIENSKRPEGDDSLGLFILLDYYIPSLKLAIELDSDYHDEENDKIRDQYLLSNLGITTFRIRDFNKESVQKTRFHELTKLLKGLKIDENPRPLDFNSDLYNYLKNKGQ